MLHVQTRLGAEAMLADLDARPHRGRRAPFSFRTVVAHGFVAIAILLCFLVLSGTVSANVFGKDQRAYRDADQPLLRSVGMLVNARRQVGTAFLIGECHAMTAFHSAFFRDRDARDGLESPDGARPGHALDFYIGPDPLKPGRFLTRTRARVIDYGHYHPGVPRGMTGDWAILELEDCLGRDYGFLRYVRPTARELVPSGELMTIGYPASALDRAGIAVEQGCRVRDTGPVVGLMAVDCAFESGMSGGPILERQRDGEWLVVGIMQLRFAPVEGVLPEYRYRHRNQMLHVLAFFRSADRALAGQAAHHGKRDPASEREIAFEQAALELVLAEQAPEIRRDPDANIALWRGDLNGDSVSELLMRVCGRNALRRNACSIHVVTQDHRGRPRTAGVLPDARGVVRLGYGQVNGWRPLIVGAHSRPAVFDDDGYRVLGMTDRRRLHAEGLIGDEEIMKVEVLIGPVRDSTQLRRAR